MEGMLAALGPMDPGGQFFVFTDASAKDSALPESVIALAQSKKIRVDFVLFGSCSPIDPGYIQIANATGGQVFFLTPAEVDQAAKLPVPAGGDERGQPALGAGLGRERVQELHVPVDSTMTDVTFSVDTTSMEVQRPGRRARAGRRRGRDDPAAHGRQRSEDRRSGRRALEGDRSGSPPHTGSGLRLEHARHEPVPVRPDPADGADTRASSRSRAPRGRSQRHRRCRADAGASRARSSICAGRTGDHIQDVVLAPLSDERRTSSRAR